MKRKYLYILLIVFFGVSLLIINIVNLPENKLDKYPEIKLSTIPDDLKDAVDAARVIKSQKNNYNLLEMLSKKTIGDELPLILQRYDNNSSVTENLTIMPDSFVGLSLKELNSVLKSWVVKEYEPGNVLILQEKKRDNDKFLVGIKDGKVAIFYISSDNKDRLLKQQTEIEVYNLPLKEREALENGIIVNNNEELLTVLESLLSINQD